MCPDRVQRPKPERAKSIERVPASTLAKRDRLSFGKLTPEQALRAFMQVDPKRVAEREREEREERERQGRLEPKGGPRQR